ncbi:hypothetical protein ACOMHN_047697 [Nucella lapillus]
MATGRMARTKDPFPMDRGWAWAIVLGCFMCVFFMVGMAKSTGIFLTYFQEHFEVSTSLAAMVIGGSAIVYAFMAPVCIMLAQLYTVRQVVMVGGVIGFVGIALSSLLYSMEYVIITFGIFFGVGNATVYGNCLVILGFYFQKRRSLANGLALSGSSLGQFALPPLIEFLLERFGLNGCLLLVGAIYLHIMVGGSLFRPVSFWSPPCPTPEKSSPLLPQEKGTQNNGRLTHTLTNGEVISSDRLQEDAVVRDAVGNTSDGEAETIIAGDVGVEGDNPHTPLISASADAAPTAGNISAGRNSTQEELASDQNHRVRPLDPSEVEVVAVADYKGDQYSHSTLEDKTDSEHATGPELVLRNRSNNLRENLTEDSASDVAVEVAAQFPSMHSKESEQLQAYRSLTASTGSLCIQPLYGSSLTIEQLQQPAEEEEEEKKSARKLCRNLAAMFDFSVMKSYVAVFITVTNFLSFFGYFNFVLFLPAAVMARGVEKYEKAILVSVTGIGDLLGRLTMAMIGDRDFLPRYQMQAFGIFAVSVNIAILIWADTYWWMVVHCALYGYFGGIYVSLTAVVIIDFVGVQHLPRLLAVVLLIQGIGASIGQPLLGGVKDATGSFTGVLAITAACCVAGGLVLLSYPLVLKLERRLPEGRRLVPPAPDPDPVLVETDDLPGEV